MSDSNNPPLSWSRAGWRTIVDLEDITWGHLRQLVRLAEAEGDDDQVEFEYNWDDSPPTPTGILLRGEG